MPGQGWVPVLERQNALAEMPADITDGLNPCLLYTSRCV